jgi:putative membrane protein
MRLLIQWLITSVALVAAAVLVPGITVEGNAWAAFAVMAVILGLVNAVVKPILKLLSCSIIVLTLGLFLLVINGITLWISSWIAVNWFNIGFHVKGFWSAFLGALIVSLVSMILSSLLGERKKKKGPEIYTGPLPPRS